MLAWEKCISIHMEIILACSFQLFDRPTKTIPKLKSKIFRSFINLEVKRAIPVIIQGCVVSLARHRTLTVREYCMPLCRKILKAMPNVFGVTNYSESNVGWDVGCGLITACDPVYTYLFLLSISPHTSHCLVIISRIPVRIKHNKSVCTNQIQAAPTSLATEHENKVPTLRRDKMLRLVVFLPF